MGAMNRACVSCKNFGLKEHPQHAAMGIGRCSSYPCATFVHIKRERPCEHYKAAEPSTVEARKVWWAKKETCDK